MRFRWSVLLLVLAFIPFAWAQIPVSDDAFTSSAAPGANYGTSLGLVVQSPSANGSMTSPPEAGGYTANTFVKFDLSALPTNLTVATLSKANLRLYVDFVVSPGSFDVCLAGGPWTEGALIANNA